MKKRLWGIGIFAGIAAIGLGLWIISHFILAPSLGSHIKFEHMLQGFFQQEVSESTLSMHYTLVNPDKYGITNYRVSFGDVSKAGREREISYLKDTRKSLKAFSRSKLSKEDQFTYDVLLDSLDSQIALSQYEIFEEPFTTNNGIQSQLPILLAEYPFHTKKDVEDYLLLLEQLPRYFDSLLNFEEEKAQLGHFMSDLQCEAVLEACEQFLENKNENFLLSSFENRIASVSEIRENERSSYIEKNRELFWNQVCPAYETVIHRLTALLGSGKIEGGLCLYENGRDYYSLLVHAETGTSESMEDLFEKIEKRRTNCLSFCAQMMKEHPEYKELIADSDRSYQNEKEILEDLSEKSTQDFPPLTDVSYRINYVEKSLEASLAPAFYITAPIDDFTNNCIYINTAKNYSDLSFFTTLAHEGFPGHLYQTVMSYQYGLTPVRAILDYPGYTEGWATYVELMSYQYAGLSDAYALLLSNNQAAMLSLYASSDIGIHYYGWGITELTEFWNTYGITDSNAIARIQELILSDPGNYLKYYVGYLKFEELKEEMSRKYGDNFCLKDFHEAILRMGPAPFDLLRSYFPYYYSLARNNNVPTP